MRKTGLFVIILAILTGCTSPRQMALFNAEAATMKVENAPKFVIAPRDVLQIKFTAVNSEAVEWYNSAGTSYQVDDQGQVEIPVIGKVTLAGMNEEQAIEYLTDLVRDKVVNPIVRLSISNATITVLGEVRNPSKFYIKEATTLLQAIGEAGGFTKNAHLKKVLVQRRDNGTIHQYRINLLTDELFSSPCYYLQKGDVVNVPPLYAQ